MDDGGKTWKTQGKHVRRLTEGPGKVKQKNEGKKITYSHQFLNRYSLISFAFFFLQPKWWLLFFCARWLSLERGLYIKATFLHTISTKVARAIEWQFYVQTWLAGTKWIQCFYFSFFSSVSLRFCLFLFQVKSAAFFALNDRSGCDGSFLELFYASSRKWKLWWCWPGPGPIKWPPVRQRKRS